MAAEANAIALLPLPDPTGLSETQTRGKSCVWCTATLATGAVVDLGARPIQAHGTRVHWFPRACRPCTAQRTLAVLHAHAPTCEQCVDEASVCDTGRALYRLVREHRR